MNSLITKAENGDQNEIMKTLAEFVQKELIKPLEEVNKIVTEKEEILEKHGKNTNTERNSAIERLNKSFKPRPKSVKETGAKQRNLIAKDIQLYKEIWPMGHYCVFKYWGKVCSPVFQSNRIHVKSTSYIYQGEHKNSFLDGLYGKDFKRERKI